MSEADTLAGSRKSRLRITEIFYSLQGESRPAGYPTAFIRLTGCPLRCHYCDTEYAFHGGRVMEIADIIQAIAAYQAKFVCVTGGEPLAQPNCLGLLTDLCDLDYRVSLETSGALDIAEVDQRVNIVMDIKTPASGEHARNRWENLEHLKPDDQLKFVISDKSDYDWSRKLMSQHQLTERFFVLLSPAWGAALERGLAEWILEDRLNVRFQIQLHKHIWGDEPGR